MLKAKPKSKKDEQGDALSRAFCGKLRAAELSQFDRSVLEDQFIPLDGGLTSPVPDEERFDLHRKVCEEFLGHPDRDVLLLMGGAGAGKTWFGQSLVISLWGDEDRDAHTPIPLWIPLVAFERPHANLIEQHLEGLKVTQRRLGTEKEEQLTDEDIRAFLKEQPPLLIVLDGYDELSETGRKQNIYQGNQFAKWRGRVQVIVTSRKEALPEQYTSFLRSDREGSRMLEYYAQSFDEKQLPRAVEQYIRNHETDWGAERYLEKLTSTHELKEFIGKPFLLRMVLEVLPDVVAEVERQVAGKGGGKMEKKDTEEASAEAATSPADSHDLLRQRLTRHRLYEAFLSRHFQREVTRLERMSKRAEIEAAYDGRQLLELFEEFTRRLAQQLFSRHVNVVRWIPQVSAKSGWMSAAVGPKAEAGSAEMKSENEEWLSDFFDDIRDPNLVHLRTACPLIRVGPHSHTFLHKSILEFYAAEHLFDGALVDGWMLTGRNLNKENLQHEPEVLKLLAERVKVDEVFKETLFAIIEQSKYEPSVWRAAANAITILNWANVGFNGRDFRRIRIGGLEDERDPNSGWGADLSYAILYKTDLQESDMRYVNLSLACLTQADLSGACMDNMQLREWLELGRQGLALRVCAYSGDGQYLAIASYGEIAEITVYEAMTLTRIKNWKIEGCTFTFAFREDGMQVAIGGRDYKIELWAVKTGEIEQVLEGHTDHVESIAYAPDGRKLASGSYDKTVRVWRVTTGVCEWILTGHTDKVSSIAYAPDGRQLTSGSYDKTVRVWQVATGVCEWELKGHTDKVSSIAYAPDSRQLASGSDDKTVRLWSVKTGECERVLEGHTEEVTSIAYAPDGRQLASGSDRWSGVCLWSVESGASRSFGADIDRITSIAYAPDGRQLALGTDNGVRQYSLETRGCDGMTKGLEGYINWVASVAYAPNGQQIVSGGVNTLCLWSAKTGECERVLEGHTKEVTSVAYAPDGRQLASGSYDETVRLWSVKTGECERVLEIKGIMRLWSGGISSVAYAPDGRQLASGSSDKTVRLWSVKTGVCERVLEGHTKEVTSVAYAPDGRQLASGSSDKTVRLWSVKTGVCERVLWNIVGVNGVAYAPNGWQLALNDDRKAVQLWSVKTGACERVLSRHAFWGCKSVAYESCSDLDPIYLSLYGKYYSRLLAVGSVNQAVQLWDTGTYSCVGMTGYTGECDVAAAWSPDGTKLATGSERGAVRLWQIRDHACGPLNIQLLWQTHSFLISDNLRLYQVTGLSEQNYRLLGQRSHKKGLIGQPADPARLTSDKVLAERNLQVYIPEGKLEQPWLKDESGNSYVITPTMWLISLVRKRTPRSTGASTLEQQQGTHVWLMIQGLDEARYSVLKTVHLFLDINKPTHVHGTIGSGLVQMRACAPYDLASEAKTLVAKSWMIARKEADQLLSNVEKDRIEGVNYLLTGRSPTFLGASDAYSCLSWCERQLKLIDIEAIERKEWRDYVCAIPTRYLPEARHDSNDAGSAAEGKKLCVVM